MVSEGERVSVAGENKGPGFATDEEVDGEGEGAEVREEWVGGAVGRLAGNGVGVLLGDVDEAGWGGGRGARLGHGVRRGELGRG